MSDTKINQPIRSAVSEEMRADIEELLSLANGENETIGLLARADAITSTRFTDIKDILACKQSAVNGAMSSIIDAIKGDMDHKGYTDLLLYVIKKLRYIQRDVNKYENAKINVNDMEYAINYTNAQIIVDAIEYSNAKSIVDAKMNIGSTTYIDAKFIVDSMEYANAKSIVDAKRDINSIVYSNAKFIVDSIGYINADVNVDSILYTNATFAMESKVNIDSKEYINARLLVNDRRNTDVHNKNINAELNMDRRYRIATNNAADPTFYVNYYNFKQRVLAIESKFTPSELADKPLPPAILSVTPKYDKLKNYIEPVYNPMDIAEPINKQLKLLVKYKNHIDRLFKIRNNLPEMGRTFLGDKKIAVSCTYYEVVSVKGVVDTCDSICKSITDFIEITDRPRLNSKAKNNSVKKLHAAVDHLKAIPLPPYPDHQLDTHIL